MHYAERIAKKIARFGELFTVGSVTSRGIFKILDSGSLSMYLDDVEKMAVMHPALFLVTGPDVLITTSDTITRDGRTYSVFKTTLHRVGDTAVARVAILS